MASKFFDRRSSESESESDVEAEHFEKKKLPKNISEFSDDDEKVKRSVKSVFEKKKEEFSAITKKLKNSLKIKDFDAIMTEFDQIHRVITKYNDGKLPNPVVKVLCELEDLTRKIWDDKDQKSKLTKQKQKVLSTLRQKIKKQHQNFVDLIQQCRNNPDTFESDWEEPKDSDSESDSEGESVPSKSLKESRPTGVKAFIKTDKTKEVTQKRERKIKASKKKSEDEEQVSKQPEKIIKEIFAPDEEITLESVLDKIREISKLRGKKITDRALLANFYEIKKVIEDANLGQPLLIKVYLIIIHLQLDTFVSDSVIRPDQWKRLLSNCHIFYTLLASSEVVVKEEITEEKESLSQPPYIIMGNCVHIIFKINDELNKIMQATDSYSLEYLNKMKDVFFFTNLISILQSYVESRGTVYQICEVYLLRVENLYYKLDFNWLVSLKDQLSDEISIDSTTITPNNVSDENLLNTLCQYLFKHGKDRMPLRAALCQVYHHAIHDRWHQAKQLFLMSRIQESIQQNDISTHILYNRVLVQLGLCAFRHGYFKDALTALRDIQLTGRSKELLAQGLIMKNTERSVKQEMLERRQLLPFHMHINLELVECVYLVSILALEGAYSIAPTQEQRNKFNSRGFIYLTRNIEKLAIHGPPETMREFVYAAFKSICVGDWKTCISHIKSIRCWKLLIHSDSVLSILTKKVKQECLAAYIFANCRAYSKITFSYLLDKFQLSDSEIKSTINRLIIHDHFPAKWNQEATVLTIFQDMLPNNSHFLISAILDRLDNLNDQQQRSVDIMNIVNTTKEKYFSKLKLK